MLLCHSCCTVFTARVQGEDDPHSYYVGYEYCRTGNPTRAAFEQAVASAESGKYAVAFSSGSAATSAVVHLLEAGSHVVSIDDVYGGTQRYFKRLVEKNSTIEFSFCDIGTDGELERAIRPNTKLIWMETPTNPTLKIADIRKIAAIAKAHNILLAVDNTFMSSYFQRPLELGADMVINSVTKFVNGHSDVVMGFVATRSKQLWADLRFVQNGTSGVEVRVVICTAFSLVVSSRASQVWVPCRHRSTATWLCGA